MANKKKSSAGNGNPTEKDFTKSGKLETDDFMELSLAVKEVELTNSSLENAQLKAQLLQSQISQLQTGLTEKQQILSEKNGVVNTKYGLVPEKDRISIVDGAITRG